ncbi:MAG: hypothetical protein Q8P41_02345 [Pseudomonadota bacterium]|nr:hypothetical protein [Pseudomonadota bacterium]
MIHAQADALRKMIREGGSVRRIVVIAVARDAANLLESGQYCIHRGVLSGEGTALLAFYDDLIDELLRTGAIDETLAANQKTVLRHNIQGVG